MTGELVGLGALIFLIGAVCGAWAAECWVYQPLIDDLQRERERLLSTRDPGDW